ncbi:MAG TPA: PIN domain-containing protein [Egibacteraceae bacterium]|nr:PIN domain-containing protein [Egibacteraceae bacterium]
MILLDTSGLFAALDTNAAEHQACRGVIEAADGPLLLSPFALAELDYLVTRRLGEHAAARLREDVAWGAYRLEPMTAADVGHAQRITQRYPRLGVGLTDASIVVLAERHDTRDLLTLDQRHFRVLRGADGRPFRLLPADA